MPGSSDFFHVLEHARRRILRAGWVGGKRRSNGSGREPKATLGRTPPDSSSRRSSPPWHVRGDGMIRESCGRKDQGIDFGHVGGPPRAVWVSHHNAMTYSTEARRRCVGIHPEGRRVGRLGPGRARGGGVPDRGRRRSQIPGGFAPGSHRELLGDRGPGRAAHTAGRGGRPAAALRSVLALPAQPRHHSGLPTTLRMHRDEGMPSGPSPRFLPTGASSALPLQTSSHME